MGGKGRGHDSSCPSPRATGMNPQEDPSVEAVCDVASALQRMSGGGPSLATILGYRMANKDHRASRPTEQALHAMRRRLSRPASDAGGLPQIS